MKSSGPVQPPSVAVWLIGLFAPSEETESILGDLFEEYSNAIFKSGFSEARNWYWRQTLKTIPHMFASGFLAAPWSTAAAVVVGYLLMVHGFRLEERGIFAVMEKYSVFDHHFRVYLFFASTGIEIGRIILSMFIGCVVALAAKQREMVATAALSLVFCAMAASAVLVWLARGQAFLLWTLPWQAAGWFAIVTGGAIVRSWRSAAAGRIPVA